MEPGLVFTSLFSFLKNIHFMWKLLFHLSVTWSEVRLAICFSPHGPDWPLASSTHSSMHVVFNSPSLRQLKLIHFLMAGVAATRTHTFPRNRDELSESLQVTLKAAQDSITEWAPRPDLPGDPAFSGSVSKTARRASWRCTLRKADTNTTPTLKSLLAKHSGCISVFFLVSHAPPFTLWNMFTLPCVRQNLLTVRPRQPFDPVFTFQALKVLLVLLAGPRSFSLESHSPPLRLRSH